MKIHIKEQTIEIEAEVVPETVDTPVVPVDSTVTESTPAVPAAPVTDATAS